MTLLRRTRAGGLDPLRLAIAGGGVIPFRFDPLLATLTPSMAVRAGALFAGAPIVQGAYDGSGTPDVLSFARGAQVAGEWYDNFDPYQGTIAFFITPEWNGNDGIYHSILDFGAAAQLLLEKLDSNILRFFTGGKNMTVSVAAWVAGQTYAIVLRWDFANKLDGTNYGSISINDVHTFGMATQPTAATPSATIYIGSTGTSAPLNARIENLTILRYPVFDGLYGIDLHGGLDVIAAHYNGGAFADPSEVVDGAWDCTMAIPTNATPGALVTGTGHAWSFPFALNALSAASGYCAVTYGASAWATIGTPSTAPADAADADKVFGACGYTWTSDAADEGIEITLAGLTAGANYATRVIAHNTQADDIRLEVYDNTNAAVIVQFDFGASSSRGVPGVALITFKLPTIAYGAGADCVSIDYRIVSTAAGQVVTIHLAELMPNLIDNPSMVAGAGNPWIPTGWANFALDAGDSASSAGSGGIIHSGADCIEFATAASNEGIYVVNSLVIANVFYSIGGWGYTAGGDTHVGTFITTDTKRQNGNNVNGGNGYLLATGAAWEHNGGVVRELITSGDLYVRASPGATDVRYADDIYAIALTAVSLTATPASAANSIEGLGLRIDGLDTLTQPVAHLGATSGDIRFTVTQRHNPALVAAFGVATPYLVDCYENANNYVRVYWSALNSLRIEYNASGGGVVTANYDATATVWAATAHAIRMTYGSFGARLLVDNINVATAAGAVVFATAFTNPVNFGHRQDGLMQLDGVISQ